MEKPSPEPTTTPGEPIDVADSDLATKLAGLAALSTAPPPPPTVGRIVWYTSKGEKSVAGETHAALITGVAADSVFLRVFTATTDFVVPAVKYSAAAPGTEEARGCWGWPPRV
jgi:hypothetical protein